MGPPEIRERTGINYNINLMIKRLLLTTISSLLLLHPVNSASALDGVIKFPGKKDSSVILEVAVTNEEKEKGLMNRSSLPERRGMVFVFRPGRKVTFWMKDTLIPLDMIFIYKGKIVKIVKNAIPNRTDILYPSDFDVTEVVEVNGGFADKHMIEIGDNIVFKNIAQIDYSIKSMLMIVPK